MQHFKRLTALVMAAVMVLSLVGCGGSGGSTAQKRPQADIQLQRPVQRPAVTTPTVPATAPVTESPEEEIRLDFLSAPVVEADRDSLEQVAQLVTGSDADFEELTDQELTDLIEEQLRQEESAGTPADPEELPVPADPAVDTDPEGYDEQGAMTVPFDQLYPELVEQAQVAYDEKTLLVKLPGSMDGTVTEAMSEAGVADLELLFELTDAAWYEARLVSGTDAPSAVEALRSIDGILLVDYNYEVRTADIGDYAEVPGHLLGNARIGEQWYLNTCGIFDGMQTLSTPGGSASVIVAVIDTGVDYDHEDLAENIWKNENELPDNGIDDDGNGYIDDCYGVNIVTGTGSGDDDNGHGTHVAGIIAAQNNNLGTVGIAYNVKIMPVKAAMASGYLHQSDIAKAILYAHQHGAQVINMSFGGTASSIAVQDALAMAYTDCVLVASAGNDGAPNEGIGAIPNYPAALSYVLGVMSVGATGRESSFSNYDTYAFNGVEYELYAPGEYLLSTIPGDGYASWSGTSMAAPVVAAMAALLRSEYPDTEMYPTKFIYGQLSATSGRNADCLDVQLHGLHNIPKIVDLHAALTSLPEPQVGVSDHYAFDTEGFDQDAGNVNNGDGVIDAGETIALGLTLRNRWGKGNDLTVTLDTLSMAGIPDPYITLHNPTVDYDSIGTYSTQDAGRIYTGELFTGWEKPFYITVAPDCPNDYIFTLNVTMSCTNGMDPDDKAEYVTQGTVTLQVRSGKVLPSVISEDLTLTSDNLYIIPSGTVITKGTTVNVEPGTHIQFWTADPEEPYADTYMASLCVNGTLNLGGTRENPVYIYPSDLMSEYAVQMYAKNGGVLNMTWADVTNLIMYYNEGGSYSVSDGYITTADHCTFRMNYGDGHIRYRNLSDGTVHDQLSNSGMMTHFQLATNCVFYKMALTYGLDVRGTLDGCIFADSALNFYQYGYTVRNCVFLGNCVGIETWDRTAIATTLQIPVPERQYTPDLTYEGYCPAVNANLYVSNQNSEITRQLMAELGYFPVTIESEDLAQFISNKDWLCQKALEFGSPEPAVGVTYEWLYAVNLGLSPDDLKNMLADAYEAVPFSIHPKFQGNVILNRISTDFDPNHWLRIEAPGGSGEEVPLGGNYWGTTNDRAIGLQIVDYSDFPASYALLNYKPVLETAPENTFPFVTDVTVFNKDGEEVTTVSNEEITVRVTFNRDMDTSIPLSVQYGSATPFRDYTIEGDYVDARTWEGKKLLTTVIENGTQYFNISGGYSAEDDLILCTDTARFAFELDTTAAQALIMQGEATAEGIRLSWTQDDFDTLMGYNVYRSDSEDGFYQRLNDQVIPADTKAFFDDTVEPGVVYYYNFTVVKTDLSESVPSGKITIQALDTMAPNIYHTPVYTAKTGSNLVVTATVTDNLSISSVKLLYRITGENTWHTAMMNGLNSKFTAIIPAMYVTTKGLDYYIEATDGISTTRRGSASAPYHITITASQEVGSLGDVDGDGSISVLDALLLLQHINDLVNLTEAQFERADLNADDRLTASEALRILQYVNGTIGSLSA